MLYITIRQIELAKPYSYRDKHVNRNKTMRKVDLLVTFFCIHFKDFLYNTI